MARKKKSPLARLERPTAFLRRRNTRITLEKANWPARRKQIFYWLGLAGVELQQRMKLCIGSNKPRRIKRTASACTITITARYDLLSRAGAAQLGRTQQANAIFEKLKD
jgi:hypothetical protein